MKRRLLHSLCGLNLLWLLSTTSFAAELGDNIGLLDAWQDETVSTSRLPKPISQTAENITVVTVDEIQAINAHTLIDVLATIPGMQTESARTLGSLTYLRAQGSSFSHIWVTINGIPFNNLGESFSDIGLIPARIIERVEIIKDAASSSWGPALGLYLNDTLSLEKFTFSPGIRFDLTGTAGDQFSPSFGVTWQLTDTTLLRAYTARGYSPQ